MALAKFEAPPSTGDALTKALGIANGILSIKHSGDVSNLAQAQTKQAQQKSDQEATTFKQAQDQYTKMSDPNSAESKQAQLESGLAIDFAASHGYTDEEHATALKGLITGKDAKGKEGEDGYSAPVPGMSALSLSKNPEISPFLSMIKGDQAAKAVAARVAPQVAKLEETKNQNSIKVGDEFENDPIIKLSKTSLNSLKKSLSILDDKSKPVTTKDLNLAYNDYINSVAAGGAATEGKINRELPETWAQTWNDFKMKSGKNGDSIDLRKDPVGSNLVEMLRKNISNVQNDMTQQISEQAVRRYQNYAETSNEKAKSIAKGKLKTYAPDAYAQMFGGGAPQASAQAPAHASALGGLISPVNAAGSEPLSPDMTPDVLVYAKDHNITNEQALSIKKQRGG